MNRYEQLRCARGLTQEEVAVGSGVSRGTVIRLENMRDPKPAHATVRALAGFYGVTVADLIGANDDRDAA